MSDPFQSPAVRAAIRRAHERRAWRAENPGKAALQDQFKAHLLYLDALAAARPGPLVLRDEWERAEWRKYSAYLDRLWNAKPEVLRAVEILRRRAANAR